MNTETAALQEENERLKLIVEALLQRIQELKKQFSSHTGMRNGDTDHPLSHTGMKNGETNQTLSNTEMMNGETNLPISNTEIRNGEINLPPSNTGTRNGEINLPISNTEMRNGKNSSFSSNTQNSTAVKQVNLDLLKKVLRKEAKLTSRKSIKNTALILSELNKDSKKSYKQLMALTELSEDGLTKRIMALKKGGLIVRTAFQTYTLTEKAIGILRSAMVDVS